MRASSRLRTALFVSLAAAAAAVLSFRPIYEPDLWWHLAQGRETAAGRLVHANVFNAIYPEYPQPYTPWLFDLGGYLAWRAAAGFGIQLAQAAWLTLTFGLVVLACRERRRGPNSSPGEPAGPPGVLPRERLQDAGATTAAAVAVLLLGFFVIEPRAIPRPHLATFAGVAACTLVIERARRTRTAAPLLWAIPMIGLWSNLHVESVFGVSCIGLFACGELVRPSALPAVEARKAVAIAAGCAAATFLNPYGWGLERYLFENWQVPQMLSIAELQPPYLPAYRAFFVYLALAAGLLLSRPRSIALWELAGAAVFAGIGVKFLRFTPLLFLVTAPMAAERLAWLIERGIDRRAVVATALAVALATSRLPLRALGHLTTGTRAVAPPAFFPPGLPAFARRTNLHGPVFNSMNLGGYLAWELYPATRIFQDGRLQAVPPGHFRAILEGSRSQSDWDRLVSGVDWAVLSNPRPDQLSGAGRFARTDWATIYWDEAVEVLVRRRGRFAVLVRPYEYTLLLPDSDAQVVGLRLDGPDRERLLAEARRNLIENPEGPIAPAVLCAGGDSTACASRF